MKVKVSLSIDGLVWTRFRSLYPSQASQKIEDFMHNMLNFERSNNNGKSVRILMQEKEAAEQLMQEATLQLEKIHTEIKSIKEHQIEEEKAELERMEKEAADQVRCVVCGIPKSNEKITELPGGKVCKSCYHTAEPQTLRKFLRAVS